MKWHFERLSSLLVLLFALVGNATALSATAFQQGIPSLAPMLAEVTPAVVSIRVTKTLPARSQFFPDRGQIPEELRRYFNFPDELPNPQQGRGNRSVGSGSGVIVNASEGLVITNHHVVEGADELEVTLHDRRVVNARLLGSDQRTDIALLQIEATGLSAMEFADSDDAQVGDYVVAIGNPFGIGQTVTAGIVSALGRAGLNNENYEDFIQTDAAINIGNSGGGLVDMEGRLLGINSAIISSSGGGSNGIGFAVPSNMVAAVMEHLLRDGEVRRGVLGVQISDLTPSLAESLKIQHRDGALVTTVMRDSAAEVAGIEVYDLIVAVNNDRIISSRELRNAVGLLRLDENVRISLVRDGREMTLNARLKTSQEVADAGSGSSRPIASDEFNGASLRSAPNGLGVEVIDVRPQSRAFNAGLRAEDLIVEVNREAVADLAAFNRSLANSEQLIALTVLRDNRRMMIIFS